MISTLSFQTLRGMINKQSIKSTVECVSNHSYSATKNCIYIYSVDNFREHADYFLFDNFL